MPLITVIMVLIVVGVLLWLVNLIPMQGTIKSILNAVVVIAGSARAAEYFRAL
jgi:hypothetical protein